MRFSPRCLAAFLSIIGLSILSSSLSHAISAEKQLQNRLNKMGTMEATFKQVVQTNKRVISRSSGTMAMKRPGKFRWKTIQPMEQLVIADGKKLWVYDVELEQVTVKKQSKGIGGTAALFLSGVDNNVERDFKVQVKKSGLQASYFLKPISDKANFQRIEMIFNQNTLEALILYDQLGQKTTVMLSKVIRNPKLPKQFFSFKPPRGVDVVQQ